MLVGIKIYPFMLCINDYVFFNINNPHIDKIDKLCSVKI